MRVSPASWGRAATDPSPAHARRAVSQARVGRSGRLQLRGGIPGQEVTEALEQQTATAEILRVISGSVTDTQPVFEAIVRSCRRLFGGKAVALFNRTGAPRKAILTAEQLKLLPIGEVAWRVNLLSAIAAAGGELSAPFNRQSVRSCNRLRQSWTDWYKLLVRKLTNLHGRRLEQACSGPLGEEPVTPENGGHGR